MGLIVGVAALAGFLGVIAQKARRMAKAEVCRSDECCGDVDANTCHWAWKFVKALSKRAQRLPGESSSVKQGRVNRVRNLEGMASSAGNAGFPEAVEDMCRSGDAGSIDVSGAFDRERLARMPDVDDTASLEGRVVAPEMDARKASAHNTISSVGGVWMPEANAQKTPARDTDSSTVDVSMPDADPQMLCTRKKVLLAGNAGFPEAVGDMCRRGDADSVDVSGAFDRERLARIPGVDDTASLEGRVVAPEMDARKASAHNTISSVGGVWMPEANAQKTPARDTDSSTVDVSMPDADPQMLCTRKKVLLAGNAGFPEAVGDMCRRGDADSIDVSGAFDRERLARVPGVGDELSKCTQGVVQRAGECGFLSVWNSMKRIFAACVKSCAHRKPDALERAKRLRVVFVGPGRIGAAVLPLLSRRGFEICVLSRREYGDFLENTFAPEQAVAQIKTCDAAVFFAGLFELNAPQERMDQANFHAIVRLARAFHQRFPSAQIVTFLDARVQRKLSSVPSAVRAYLYSKQKLMDWTLEKALEWGREGAQETAIFEQKSTLAGDNAARKTGVVCCTSEEMPSPGLGAVMCKTRCAARVNAIAPGPVFPPPQKEHSEKAGDCLTPRPTPREIAAALEFLLTSPSVTGQILYLSSGQQLL